jgi:hypothetical protein
MAIGRSGRWVMSTLRSGGEDQPPWNQWRFRSSPWSLAPHLWRTIASPARASELRKQQDMTPSVVLHPERICLLHGEMLSAAISATLAAVASADAPPAPAKTTDKAKQRQREKDARQCAGEAARRVFPPIMGPHTDSGRIGPARITGIRPPARAEQAAARRLARLLRAAAHRERVAVTTTSATPPGRLRMRGALAADAQRAAGATPTAEPFTQTSHRHVPAPPLRVGIACDVSASMRAVAAPGASAAWILARAAAAIGRVDVAVEKLTRTMGLGDAVAYGEASEHTRTVHVGAFRSAVAGGETRPVSSDVARQG